ncbi:MAG: universal stress protein UspA [Bacteroidetes bacterium 46-16]|jgi:nucleotide-binding universal stress UspA family protein|nr:MAG: universal stress protein UspA [Bacteroidetes bacterium 46-16]
MTYKKILIAVDSSEPSMKAAEQGLALAHQLKAQAALVYVIDDAKAIGNVDAGILPDQALLVLKKEAEETLEQLAKMYNGKELMKFMPEGRPVEDILETAKTWKADLLVLGTHARTGLAHLFVGSIAEQVLRHAVIPIMVVPVKQ